MAINVTFYTFSKRENSTKQPSSGGTTFSCTMIDDTSLMNPTFKLSIASNPIGMNYAYVADFNRYYFIRDIRTYQNFWYISCECDVLASFKSEISAEQHYVLRSSHSYDGSITDNMYPAKAVAHEQTSDPAEGDPFDWDSNHCYVLGVVGEAPSNSYQIGSLVYYRMDEAALRFFMGWLMDNVDTWSGLNGEYSQGVQKALINPMQYIKSCMVLPVAPPTAAEEAVHRPTSIKFGYYSCSMSGVGKLVCVLASSPMAYESDLIPIPKHPLAATRGSYLNCQPFSSYDFHFGPFGDIPLDPMVLNKNSNIFMSLAYDLTSGLCRMVLKGNEASTDEILFNGSAQVGVNINLSQVYVDGLAQTKVETDAVFSMAGAVANGITNMNPVGALVGVAQAATTGIQDATRLDYPLVTGLPNGGALLSFHDTWNAYLLHKYYDIVDEDLTELGRPLCVYAYINTLSGYILCSGAECEITGTLEESQKINGYLNGGFFYE